ncbi:MAG TPA: nucleoside triphosphate pyrophosphatase [bacterium]|nr:nucleoside triphosphate pyrophosphatase [bacterium]
MTPETLILASASPRRRDILRFAGIPFRVIAPKGVDEAPRKGERPDALARRLALAKAVEVSVRNPDAWVLGADTVVAIGARTFGKPRNVREARTMLRNLQGRAHAVYTGVALVRNVKKRRVRVERTRVLFKKLSSKEWGPYLKSREPYDKAGGYAIQGTARKWVRRYEGEYFTVLGLSLRWLLAELNRL